MVVSPMIKKEKLFLIVMKLLKVSMEKQIGSLSVMHQQRCCMEILVLIKASPINYLESFLQEYSSNVSNKFVVLHQEGELYCNPEILNLFQWYKYKVLPTRVNASFQNGPVKHLHTAVVASIRALLFGAGLSDKIWPYAFLHVIFIRNALLHRNQTASPLFMTTGKKDDFKNLRTFGLRVFVRPPGIQKKPFKENTWQEIFLGYVPHTDCLILWYDEGTEQVKIAPHAKFEDRLNDLPIDNFPLKSQQVLDMNSNNFSSDKD